MKRAIWTVLIAPLLWGCPEPDPGTKSFDHRGFTRSYKVTVPSTYTPDEPPPVVVALHGLASNARDFDATTEFSAMAERYGFIAVFPEALASVWHFPDYNVEQDDVRFVSRVVDAVAAEYAVDLDRIYLVGFSHGGILAYQVACEYPDRFAALAGVSSVSMPLQPAEACPLSMRIPVMMIEGSLELIWANDGRDLVMVDGLSFEFVPSIRSPEFWTAQNVCGPGVVEEEMPDLDPEDGTRVVRREYEDCDPAGPVVYYEVVGGHHNWPSPPEGQANGFGNVSYDIRASEEIWAFLREFRLSDRLGDSGAQ